MAKRTKTVAHKARATRKVDPVVTEIVRNGVIAVTEEMKTNLMRTAYNIIIYEALDFTTGLFTPRGETISIGIGLPMFIRGMAETVKAKIKHFDAGNIRPDQKRVPPELTRVAADHDVEHRIGRRAPRQEQQAGQGDDRKTVGPFLPSRAAHSTIVIHLSCFRLGLSRISPAWRRRT